MPVSIDARGVGRHREDVEVAVYFCCLEALQNFVKHAGRDATARVRLREDTVELCFEVRDTGIGFDQSAARDEHGLINMRDRIEAVGGQLTIISRPGEGTLVRGTVPIARELQE
jgi:signal transduction histidine kinase